MSAIVNLPITDWQMPVTAELQNQAIRSLEHGDVLAFPELSFAMSEAEQQFFFAINHWQK